MKNLMMGVSALAVLQAGAAWAQESSVSDPKLDSIIVTANKPTSVGKLDVPLRDQPQNVSVISRETLDHFGKARIQDVAYATVGLQPIALQQGATFYGFFLRGFNGAPLITDGYYSSNNQFGSVGVVDMVTADSVEVLRGPASLLYGQGNPGGVINITTKTPRADFGASLSAIADDIGTQRAEGDLTGQITEGLTGRIVGVYEDSDLFTDFIEQERILIAPQIKIEAGDLTARFQYVHDDLRYTADNGPGSNEDLAFNLPVGRSVQEPGLPKNRAVNDQVRAEMDYRFGDNWTARGGFFWHEGRQPRGNTEIDPDVTIGGTEIGRVLITTIEPDNNGSEDYMLTGQLLGKFDTGFLKHNLTAAFDYIDNRSRYDYAYYAYTPIDYANPVYTPGPVVADPANLLFSGEGAFKSEIKALYVQDLIALNDQWKILLGLRREDIKTVGYADPDANIRTNTSSESKTTPRAGVVFDMTDKTTFYGSYSEAFTPQYGLDFFGNQFAPEESTSYELGVRQQFGDRMLLTAAIYDITKKNILVVDPDPLHSGFNVTAGEARSKGAEVELQGRLTDNWRVATGFAYTDATIEKTTDPIFFPEGDRLPAAAKWSALFNTSYEFQGALEGLEIGGNVSYTSKRPMALPNSARDLPAYTKLDLFASYQLTQTVDVQVNVNNVTDERIVLANGYGRAQFDAPRAYFLTLRYRMGSLGR